MFLESKYNTPIQNLTYSDGKNNFYIKRDDLLPFSFGGNKVRIAQEYFKDMKKKNCDCIVAYGSSQSNLSRVIANMSKSKNIPCFVITVIDSDGNNIDSSNSLMVDHLAANIIICEKKNVPKTIEKVINECKIKGYKPYYIYGDIYGKGNEKVAVQAYVNTYEEIKDIEYSHSINFDYIFHASGTGATQSGLICGSLLSNDGRKIIGISIARNAADNIKNISNNIFEYMGKHSGEQGLINFEDKYVLDGYGDYNDEILSMMRKLLECDGIPLDPIYTGKAFWGMTEYLNEHDIEGKKILFVHTGGTPLFFDNLKLL